MMKETFLGAAVRLSTGAAVGAIRTDKPTSLNSPTCASRAAPCTRPRAVALMEGMAFARSAFGGELTKPDYRHVASAVFCQPPLATGEWHDGLVPSAVHRTVEQQPCRGKVAFCPTATPACMQPEADLCGALDVTLQLQRFACRYQVRLWPTHTNTRIYRVPCALRPAVGYTEDQAVKEFSGNIDVYVSRFRCVGQVCERARELDWPWARGSQVPATSGHPGCREGGMALHGGASAHKTERRDHLRDLRSERSCTCNVGRLVLQPALAQPHCNGPTRALPLSPPPSPRPMKYTISGREEKTLMKLIVHAETDLVLGCHMWVPGAGQGGGREEGREGQGRGRCACLMKYHNVKL